MAGLADSSTDTDEPSSLIPDTQHVLKVIRQYFTVQNTLLFDMVKGVEKITPNGGDGELREWGLYLKDQLRESARQTFDREREAMESLWPLCSEFVELERAANHVERPFLRLPDVVPSPGAATPRTPDDLEIVRNLRTLAKFSPSDRGSPTDVEYAERLMYVQQLEEAAAAGPVACKMRTVPPPAHSAWPKSALKYKKDRTRAQTNARPPVQQTPSLKRKLPPAPPCKYPRPETQ